jgi:hypothetical protein
MDSGGLRGGAAMAATTADGSHRNLRQVGPSEGRLGFRRRKREDPDPARSQIERRADGFRERWEPDAAAGAPPVDGGVDGSDGLRRRPSLIQYLVHISE